MKLLLFAALFVCFTAFAQDIVEPIETPVVAIAPLQFTYQPIIIDNVMMVALNDLTENIAITKTLDRDLLTLSYKDKRITIKLNSTEAEIDSIKTKLPFRTFTIRDYFDKKTKKYITFLPLRFVAQTLVVPVEIVDGQSYIDNKLWEFGDKKILALDLQKQRGSAYEGEKLARTFPTCTGKDGFETETGIFQTYKKVNARHKVVGREWGGYMYKPVYFNDCTAAHGSSKMCPYRDSHGCARLYNETADWLIEWTPGRVPTKIKGDVFWYIPKEERITVYVF